MVRRRDLLAIGAVSAAAAATYAALTLVLKAQVRPELAVVDPALPWVVILPVLLGLAAVAVTPGRALPALWARAVALGTPSPPTSWRLRPAEPARPAAGAVAVALPATTSGA